MISPVLAALVILCSVAAIQGDEPLQNVRRHRVTGQYVTRIHRITVKVPATYDTVESTSSYDTVESGSSYDTVSSGGSFEGNFGTNRRRRCNRGLIDKTATGVRDTVNGGVGKLMGALSSITNSGAGLIGGAANAVGHAAGHIIQGKFNEVDYMINDAACGLGNIANAAADMMNTGDVIGGVGKMGQEFVGGVANMGQDFVSQAAQGIGNAAKDNFDKVTETYGL